MNTEVDDQKFCPRLIEPQLTTRPAQRTGHITFGNTFTGLGR